MGPRSLSLDENARVLTALRRALNAGETQVSLSKKLSVNQATLSSLLARRHAAGFAFARRLAETLSIPLEQLLSESHVSTAAMQWSSLPGWNEAVRAAQALFPRVSVEAWEWLGKLSGPPVPGLAPGALALIASAWDQADHSGTVTPTNPRSNPKK